METDIAVIVPVYNAGKYINKCVESILAQTFKNFELVLIDDGSTDASSDICDAFEAADSRVHVIHNENEGPSYARNTGIDWVLSNTSCKWITFVDSDDYIYTTYLQRLYELAYLHDTKCSVIGLSYVSDYQQEGKAKAIEEMKIAPDDAFCYYTPNGDADFSLTCVCGKLFHLSLFSDIRFPEGRLMEDRFTTYRLLFQCDNIAVNTQHLYMYYQSPGSIMRSEWTPGKLDELAAFDEQLKYFRKNSYCTAYAKTLAEYLTALNNQLDEVEKVKEYRVKYYDEIAEKNKCALEAIRQYPTTFKEFVRWHRHISPIKYSRLWCLLRKIKASF